MYNLYQLLRSNIYTHTYPSLPQIKNNYFFLGGVQVRFDFQGFSPLIEV